LLRLAEPFAICWIQRMRRPLVSGKRWAISRRCGRTDCRPHRRGLTGNLPISVFAQDATNQTSTSVVAPPSKFCGSDSEVLATFGLES
jgi:hypothetical protein